MAGIMEEISSMGTDVSVINNPAVESEIFMNALRASCSSDQEFAALLESAGTEMALYDLISDENIATEVVKKIQVNDWKAANFNRICHRTAIRLAMINNDALYSKYRKYRDLMIEVRNKIYTKYEAKARNTYGNTVLKTVIRPCSRLAECADEFKDIIAFDPKCNGALDYTALWDEMNGIIEKSEKGKE